MIMMQSHLTWSRPVWAKEDNFRKMEWAVDISWQLRGLCGNYGSYVAVTGCMWRIWSMKMYAVMIVINAQYAVKAQTSLAPLSRFRGSRVTTAHEQQRCKFQSYAKTVPSPMKLTKREPHSWDPQRTTWSRLVTSDFNSVFNLHGCQAYECQSCHFIYLTSRKWHVWTHNSHIDPVTATG